MSIEEIEYYRRHSANALFVVHLQKEAVAGQLRIELTDNISKNLP